ncbi:MAG: hypothetical protein IT428_31715 [Planctomycetaceae bacterium]|nr:hypothetical protein [Planctomycetaceae bacterium]
MSDTDIPSVPPPALDEDCPLSVAAQRWNMLCFAGVWCLYYLSAPIVYVGITHGNLARRIGYSNEDANLPLAWYSWMMGVPVLVAWLIPNPRYLKSLVVMALLCIASVTAVIPVAIALKASREMLFRSLLIHGAVLGAANGVAITSMWEMIRRGVSTSRRGAMLGLTFGIGPVMACTSTVVQQALLDKIPWFNFSFGTNYPENYLWLFGLAVPLIALCAGLAASFRLPEVDETQAAQTQWSVAGLRDFFTTPALILAAVAYLLVYSGGANIGVNVSLNAKLVVTDIEDSQGIQQFLRFGLKAVAGVFLGWLLAKTNPRMPLIATTLILMSGLAWVLGAEGSAYLFAFGILGAGELFGAYFPNYITTASPKHLVRSNMAYLNVLGSLVGFSSVLYGKIAGVSPDGKSASPEGLRMSFLVAEGILLAGLLLVMFGLPRRPIPAETAATDGSLDSGDSR